MAAPYGAYPIITVEYKTFVYSILYFNHRWQDIKYENERKNRWVRSLSKLCAHSEQYGDHITNGLRPDLHNFVVINVNSSATEYETGRTIAYDIKNRLEVDLELRSSAENHWRSPYITVRKQLCSQEITSLV